MSPLTQAPVRGAIVVTYAATPWSPQHIPFQFNPATVRASITGQTVGGEPGGHSEVLRLAAAPVEVLTFDLELDAFNELPNQSMAKAAVESGVGPQLAALAGILYPKSAEVEAMQRASDAGTMQVAPFVAPQVLLVLGANRVVPIAVQSYRIIEHQFDSHLNPMRATVTMTARMLTYSDVTKAVPAYNSFMTYQKTREQLAKSAFVNGMPSAE
jgi:hypothetical protein